ncbi:MAG: helix-turn-helix transcriptional regulator [Ramlibacter sp.]
MYATAELYAQGQASRATTAIEPPASADFAWRVLEEIDYGLLLVSPSGALQHANHLARHELGRARFLRIEANIVVGHMAAQTEEINKAVRGAAQGRRQMLTLRNGDDTLHVACVPLFPSFEGRSGSVLLMLARQTGTQNLNVTFFARSHGLTPAEEAVLKALCDGLDVHEIAISHGVSEYTIRTQVRSLRDKTGINSMRLLVQRVAALPPVVPMSLTNYT